MNKPKLNVATPLLLILFLSLGCQRSQVLRVGGNGAIGGIPLDNQIPTLPLEETDEANAGENASSQTEEFIAKYPQVVEKYPSVLTTGIKVVSTSVVAGSGSDLNCPAGSVFRRTSDNPTLGLCVVEKEHLVKADQPIPTTLGTICGAAREQGKRPSDDADACSYHLRNDNSCDQMGCAITLNNAGTSGCPQGTFKLYTSKVPDRFHFVCIMQTPAPVVPSVFNVGSGVVEAVANFSGGSRRDARQASDADNNACTLPANPGSYACDMWGRAADIGAGRGGCMAGTSLVRVSDGPTYHICLNL